jgi:diguanylate cyclase (GGDEF)-like protein
MNATPYQLLCIGPAPQTLAISPWGPFQMTVCTTLDAAASQLRAQHFDALLTRANTAGDLERLAVWPALSQAVLDAAVVLVAPQIDPAWSARLLQMGLQDLLTDVPADLLGRALRLAIERKQLERAARKAYATDLATGLPNHAQLLEHMTHLLALREREPAPMALLALRIDGLATAAAALGAESANVLRRKVAVRLRAGLRASDVVASIGNDAFAVLLAWIDAPADGERVAQKLVQSLQQPFGVAGRDVAVAASAGVSHYPEHGKDAATLLRHAVGQAASAVPVGRPGFANRVERGFSAAANDEEPPAE